MIEIQHKKYNYFRYGFMIGIWQTLLDNYDFDLLIHCQTRNLIGENLNKYIIDFKNKKDKILMAPSFHSLIGSSIDVSLMFMKRNAVISYTQTGVRQNFEFFSQKCLNCEEEAFLMFRNNWYNPWKNILLKPVTRIIVYLVALAKIFNANRNIIHHCVPFS